VAAMRSEPRGGRSTRAPGGAARRSTGPTARLNDQVAALLRAYADLLSISGSESYKVRVYERGARAVAGHHADVSALDLDGLRAIPGVGASIGEKILEYLHSGQVEAVERLRAK